MQKINYNDKMEEIVNGINGDRKKKLPAKLKWQIAFTSVVATLCLC